MEDTVNRLVIERKGWNLHVVNVEISSHCPVCGGIRGEPKWHHFCEDGDWLVCQTWNNPCGHVDLYRDLLIEAVNISEARL